MDFVNKIKAAAVQPNTKKGDMSGDWSQLPNDILCLIGNRLKIPNSAYPVHTVCKSWSDVNLTIRTVCKSWSGVNLAPQPPWLVLYRSEHERRSDRRRKKRNPPIHGIVGLGEQKVYELDLSGFCGALWVGSAGDLLVLKDCRLRICLFKPLSSAPAYFLPSLAENIKKVCVSKIAWTTMAITTDSTDSTGIRISKPHDALWYHAPASADIHDVIFYKRYFYTVDATGIVSYWQIEICEARRFADSKPLKVKLRGDKNYVVECSGELLLVVKYSKRKWRRFKVFKKDDRRIWHELKSLGNYSLFLGKNTSVSVLCSEYHGSVKKNCIYFTDDDCNGKKVDSLKFRGHDMGVFDMEDGRVTPHFNDESTNHHWSPFWIIPQPAETAEQTRKRKRT